MMPVGGPHSSAISAVPVSSLSASRLAPRIPRETDTSQRVRSSCSPSVSPAPAARIVSPNRPGTLRHSSSAAWEPFIMPRRAAGRLPLRDRAMSDIWRRAEGHSWRNLLAAKAKLVPRAPLSGRRQAGVAAPSPPKPRLRLRRGVRPQAGARLRRRSSTGRSSLGSGRRV